MESTYNTVPTAGHQVQTSLSGHLHHITSSDASPINRGNAGQYPDLRAVVLPYALQEHGIPGQDSIPDRCHVSSQHSVHQEGEGRPWHIPCQLCSSVPAPVDHVDLLPIEVVQHKIHYACFISTDRDLHQPTHPVVNNLDPPH